MSSQFFFSLDSIQSVKKDAGGSLTCVTSKEVPGFVNISFATLRLHKNGFQEPIWHPNANKIGYCLQGTAQIAMRTPSSLEVYTLTSGDVFFIPKGYVYEIKNLGEDENIIHFVLDHANPQVMSFAKALQSLSEDVFTATFNTSPGFINELKKAKNAGLIKTLSSTKNESSLFISNRYKFNVGESTKAIQTQGGYLQAATKTNLPVLEGLGILTFGLNPKGIVEPHWHTNAGELVYIVKGRTRITILSPDGKIDELEVKGGQGAFAPASYFHNIENIGDENVEVIAFFNHAEPNYIGFGEVLSSYSNDVLVSIFNVAPSYFDQLQKPSGPLVIVPI
jgi:oxalate decarboxylase